MFAGFSHDHPYEITICSGFSYDFPRIFPAFATKKKTRYRDDPGLGAVLIMAVIAWSFGEDRDNLWDDKKG
jgi:hypothetical protein